MSLLINIARNKFYIKQRDGRKIFIMSVHPQLIQHGRNGGEEDAVGGGDECRLVGIIAITMTTNIDQVDARM